MKKIFFNYSADPDDGKMMRNLCLHFSVLKNNVELWHKGKILPGDVIEESLRKNLDDSDLALHLLSISYAAEDQCVSLLEEGIVNHKKNVPVLLSSFDWQSMDSIRQLENELLPGDHKPVDTHPNYNEIYTEIVIAVKQDLLGIDTKTGTTDRLYFYLLAGVLLTVGSVLAYWANGLFNNLGITLMVFAMFVFAAVFILRKIIFPTSVSTSKW